MIAAGRYHDFSAGHRVAGHENKCAALHGHNYRVFADVVPKRASKLDSVGRVLDFAGIKEIGEWLEREWDHKFLYWEKDDVMCSFLKTLRDEFHGVKQHEDSDLWHAAYSFVSLSFNPTAENIAVHLGTHVAPMMLPADVFCREVVVWETRKCYAYWRHNG